MNIEAYDLESLRKIVRTLQKENNELKELLRIANIPFSESDYFEDKYEEKESFDEDQGDRIICPKNITDDMAKLFFSMFWGRQDVFAKRGKNGGYFPQCKNRWEASLCPKQRGEKVSCDDCDNKDWTQLELWRVKEHLKGQKEDGTDVLGIYPLFEDGTCRFIVFDFDNHEKGSELNDYANVDNEWHEEVDALRKMCLINGIKPLVERSRSGRGAHVWIFFKRPIQASIARNFGFMLLDKGSSSINMKSFHYYDRMYPSQDSSNGIGNLIALPLQGRAIKFGNSAFVDENWNAYPDQWRVLLHDTEKLDLDDIESYMSKWQIEMAKEKGFLIPTNEVSRPKPWRKKCEFFKSDVVGKLHIVLSDGVYVDSLNIMPSLQNQIRSLAAFDNPEFYKNKRLGYSNYYNFSSVYLGKDVDGYICVPRGLRERILDECTKAGIETDISDERKKGRPIRVSFNGDLRTQQELAAQKLLSFSDGVLSAATAFGKTVVCSYLISERKVNTLILLQSKDLLAQWVEELQRFLDIKEEAPEYETKTGRKKKRDSVIGILHGNKNTLTGIIDVAMVQSMNGKDNLSDRLNSYGMVIMDECHHAASSSSMELLQRVKAKYVYGVSATPKRGDNLDKIIYMMLGPVRHTYSALERAIQQGIGHYIVPRYTRVVDSLESKENIGKAYSLIASNEVRNNMIISDVSECVKNGESPVILTRTKEHAKYLADKLQQTADHVFLLYGDNTDKENLDISNNLKKIPKHESLILIATGQKIGEGFDFPRLDVLMLAAPVSFEGRLEQYVGRLNRDYDGKEAVYVYDYIDSHVRFFDRMYGKRLRTYKKMGFSLWTEETKTKQIINSIFDSGNYTEKFEQDLVEAEKSIVISSPDIRKDKTERFIYIIKTVQENGVNVTVITLDPDSVMFGSSSVCYELIDKMKKVGIQVIVKEEVDEHFAVIDDCIVWHGGMNLLGKEDAWDNLMRIKNIDVASELLELSLGKA